MSYSMTKPTKWQVHPVKTQISLGIRPVWSESSLCAQWVAEDPRFLHVDSADWSDLSLRWAHVILLVLSWGGSYVFNFWMSKSYCNCFSELIPIRRCLFDQLIYRILCSFHPRRHIFCCCVGWPAEESYMHQFLYEIARSNLLNFTELISYNHLYRIILLVT